MWVIWKGAWPSPVVASGLIMKVKPENTRWLVLTGWGRHRGLRTTGGDLGWLLHATEDGRSAVTVTLVQL